MGRPSVTWQIIATLCELFAGGSVAGVRVVIRRHRDKATAAMLQAAADMGEPCTSIRPGGASTYGAEKT